MFNGCNLHYSEWSKPSTHVPAVPHTRTLGTVTYVSTESTPRTRLRLCPSTLLLNRWYTRAIACIRRRTTRPTCVLGASESGPKKNMLVPPTNILILNFRRPSHLNNLLVVPLVVRLT